MRSLSRVRLFATPWTVACTRLLHPWDFLDKSTGVGCHFLLQGIFPTQGSNPGLPHCRQKLYHLSHQEAIKRSKFCHLQQCGLTHSVCLILIPSDVWARDQGASLREQTQDVLTDQGPHLLLIRVPFPWPGLPGGSDGKASVYNAGDLGSIPGSGSFPGEGNGNPLQYSCLENPMDGGAWCRLLSMGSQTV